MIVAIFESHEGAVRGASFVGAGCTAAPLSFRPPSSSGLGFRVLSAATGVRFPVGVFFEGGRIAQLVRAHGSHP